MAAPRAANYRQVFCSSTVLRPSVILGPSPFAAQRTQDSERNTPVVKIQGTPLRFTVNRCGSEQGGSIQGHSGR
ncbi:hypothetical protein CesoFtcFv8_012869 [Champsocephalus esox]|uniref:Uncharacterized protein n=1 Tax=Champsocephalus esox TaxID=159716 RepID=A0AAN8BZS0_9TELE|nr:hypothetical protein CesoFtcFv8_012869 [Champsocephalus esox]